MTGVLDSPALEVEICHGLRFAVVVLLFLSCISDIRRDDLVASETAINKCIETKLQVKK